jgi:hypothetical protein
MGRPRLKDNDLPKGLYRHRATFRTPLAAGGYKTFGGERTRAIEAYNRWLNAPVNELGFGEDAEAVTTKKF